ncbi:MFS transporter [Mesorhizobium qingshengii]|uniref:MFS transporter, CP family, cyanate transporter n=1 Tax=Mesorhizobium qingshengii TaxID=1165689 RepID=A0A1G5ZFS0_9HYPH|nr:MFS transporter [Mesorhizobium qingshengii]SDA93123.1 MFS transporter, CP family, cyanate transporter [Mesorhizobium qingshengii]
MTAREIVRTTGGQGLLLVGIMLIASTLRAPITSVAPMLGMIRETTGISAAEAGGLTTLPLLAFAAISPFAAGLARRYGIERSLFGALPVVATGTALRSTGPLWALFVGTGTLGAGIAVANVLLPGLLKRDFPNRVAGLTGGYAIVSGLSQALASTAAIPLAQLPGSSWHLSLACTLIFPFAALIAWAPQLQMPAAPERAVSSTDDRGHLWRSALAWQVTGFLGLTSLVFYVIVGWLPSILAEAGYPAATAGSLHGLCQLAIAIPGLLLGTAVKRMKDQRAMAIGVALITCLSLLGLWQIPALAALWVALFGFGAGAAFVLGLSFVSLRVSHSQEAAALSGMAQCLGYSLAAAGPPLAGLAHDATGNWSLALGACAIDTLLMAVLGSLAGRAKTI